MVSRQNMSQSVIVAKREACCSMNHNLDSVTLFCYCSRVTSVSVSGPIVRGQRFNLLSSILENNPYSTSNQI